jgi:heat shock protein HslJ
MASMTRASKTLAAVLLIAVTLVAVDGCSASGSTLDGTRWRLTGWTLDSLSPSDFAISAKFDGEQISGNGGVNSYGGPYQLGPGDAFSAGPLASTRMAGPEPAMRAEGGYLALLGQAKTYQLVEGKLTLYDEAGKESLSFEAASQ